MGEGLVVDGAVAKSQSQAASMWRVREGIAEACGRRGESIGRASAVHLLYACFTSAISNMGF